MSDLQKPKTTDMEKGDFKFNGKFIDIKSDWGFKKLFGTEENKALLIDFLNATFKDKCIVDIEYLTSENLGTSAESKHPVFDVICRTKQGEIFVVEMQNHFQDCFADRMIAYLCATVSRFLDKGFVIRSKEGEYVIPDTRILAIINFRYFGYKKYFSSYHFHEDELNDLLSPTVGLYYIELPKFQKKERELKNLLEKWLYLFNNLQGLNDAPAGLDGPIFEKLYSVASFSALSRNEQQLYQSSIMNAEDYEIAKRSYGRAEVRKFKREMVVKLLKDGISDELIKTWVDLSGEELEQIKSTME